MWESIGADPRMRVSVNLQKRNYPTLCCSALSISIFPISQIIYGHKRVCGTSHLESLSSRSWGFGCCVSWGSSEMYWPRKQLSKLGLSFWPGTAGTIAESNLTIKQVPEIKPIWNVDGLKFENICQTLREDLVMSKGWPYSHCCCFNFGPGRVMLIYSSHLENKTISQFIH